MNIQRYNPIMDLDKLSKILTKRKKELRYTDKEISEKARVSRPYWIALRTGKNPKTGKPSRPSFDVLARLIKTLELDFNAAMKLVGYQTTLNGSDGEPKSEVMSRDEIIKTSVLESDGRPVSIDKQIDSVYYSVQLRELVEDILRDSNIIKNKALLSFLKWLKAVPDETFELPERLSKGFINKELTEIIFKRDNYRCSSCGASNTELYVNHITPISRGGSNDPANFTTLCETCRN